MIKGIRGGTVKIDEVPDYRLGASPSGGIKEGVIEAIKFMTTVKTFSRP